MMISGSTVSVLQTSETDIHRGEVRGIKREIIISPKYLDEPEFSQEQMCALHEICESFILTNRARERNRRKRDRAKEKAKGGDAT